MIRFDVSNSVNKAIFMKAVQQSNASDPLEQNPERKSGEQHLILSALQEIEQSNEKTAIGLVNALFLSSTSHALDKVCLNIFSRLGDSQSLKLLYKKYPTPESISISLLPYYIRALGFLGHEAEIEQLAVLGKTFWGLYRSDMIGAFESIAERTGAVDVSDDVVRCLQHLFDASDATDKKRIIELGSKFQHGLYLSIIISGVQSEIAYVRKAAIPMLGNAKGHMPSHVLAAALKHETDEDILEEYDAWMYHSQESNESP